MKYLPFLALVTCTPGQLEKAKSAVAETKNYRDQICALATVANVTEMIAACETDASLKEIAAVYAGCSK